MQTIQSQHSREIDSPSLPNPVKTSRLQQLINWIVRPYDYLDECARKYGDSFTMHLFGFDNLVFLSNPKAIKDIFADNGTRFEVGRGQRILQPLVGDHSLLVLDGARHQRERKMLMPPFHGSKVKSYADAICDITTAISSRWPSGEHITCGELMPDITLEVILQTVFGLGEGDRYQQLKSLLISLLDLTGSPTGSSLLFFRWFQKDLGPWSPWGKFVRKRQQVYALLQSEIEDRRSQKLVDSQQADGNDILSLMLLARDENGQPMTDEELKDELITMLVAGHETTSAALCWAMYWIHKLPQVKEKLMAELNSIGDRIAPLAIASLPYLTAVASETLRLYPIAPIAAPRISKAAVTIAGHTFPPNTFLTPAIYSVHHREDLYPDSKTFNPERFLERQFTAYEFLPFGGGNRRCIGYALAKLELNLVLATLLTQHTFRLATDETVTPRRRGVVLATSNGVPLIVES